MFCLNDQARGISSHPFSIYDLSTHETELNGGTSPHMKINKIVEEVLSEDAVELLNILAANAIATTPAHGTSLFYLTVEPENWNATMMLMREIFEGEIMISGEGEWVAFRVLQSFGVSEGRLAYQFTPTFTEALST
jgi:hypothetical protein